MVVVLDFVIKHVIDLSVCFLHVAVERLLLRAADAVEVVVRLQLYQEGTRTARVVGGGGEGYLAVGPRVVLAHADGQPAVGVAGVVVQQVLDVVAGIGCTVHGHGAEPPVAAPGGDDHAASLAGEGDLALRQVYAVPRVAYDGGGGVSLRPFVGTQHQPLQQAAEPVSVYGDGRAVGGRS